MTGTLSLDANLDLSIVISMNTVLPVVVPVTSKVYMYTLDLASTVDLGVRRRRCGLDANVTRAACTILVE